jgi:hypothetical protein
MPRAQPGQQSKKAAQNGRLFRFHAEAGRQITKTLAPTLTRL